MSFPVISVNPLLDQVTQGGRRRNVGREAACGETRGPPEAACGRPSVELRGPPSTSDVLPPMTQSRKGSPTRRTGPCTGRRVGGPKAAPLSQLRRWRSRGRRWRRRWRRRRELGAPCHIDCTTLELDQLKLQRLLHKLQLLSHNQEKALKKLVTFRHKNIQNNRDKSSFSGSENQV